MSETGFIRGGTTNLAEGEVIDASTGAGFSGAVTVYVSVDGSTPALGTVGSGAGISQGSGWFKYVPSAAESDGRKCTFQFRGAGAVSALAQYYSITEAQAAAITTATGTGVRYVQTLIRNAMMGLSILSPREVLKPDDADFCLSHLNLIFDDWNADIQTSYAERFTVFASTGANPETIGPSGTWVSTRPVAIDGVAYDTGSGIYQELFVTMDPRWWAAQNLVTDGGVYGAYYAATATNGSLYFANLPDTATNIRIMRRTELAAVTLTDALSLPPGYESALMLTLEERIAGGFHAPMPPDLKSDAGKARARIFKNNLRISPLSTRGLGLPNGANGRWDYRTGRFV